MNFWFETHSAQLIKVMLKIKILMFFLFKNTVAFSIRLFHLSVGLSIWQHPRNFIALLTLTHSWISVQVVVEGSAGKRGRSRGRERGGRQVLAGTRSALCTAATRGHGRSFPTSCASVTHTGTCDRRTDEAALNPPSLRQYIQACYLVHSQAGLGVAARHTVTPPTCKDQVRTEVKIKIPRRSWGISRE